MTNRIPWGPDSPGYPTCPVPAGHDCTVYFREQHPQRKCEPELWRWKHEGWGTDIIAYCDHAAPDQARELLAEAVAREIERYGDGLVPDLAVVCSWLATHFRNMDADEWAEMQARDLKGAS